MLKNWKFKMFIFLFVLLFIIIFKYSNRVESLPEKDKITNEINKCVSDTSSISEEKKVKSNSAIEDAQETLRKIYQLCNDKNYEKLRNYIYPFFRGIHLI